MNDLRFDFWQMPSLTWSPGERAFHFAWRLGERRLIVNAAIQNVRFLNF